MPAFYQQLAALAVVIIGAGPAIDFTASSFFQCRVARAGTGDYALNLQTPLAPYELAVTVTPIVAAGAGAGSSIICKVTSLPSALSSPPFTQVKLQFQALVEGALADPVGFFLRVDRVSIGLASEV